MRSITKLANVLYTEGTSQKLQDPGNRFHSFVLKQLRVEDKLEVFIVEHPCEGLAKVNEVFGRS